MPGIVADSDQKGRLLIRHSHEDDHDLQLSLRLGGLEPMRTTEQDAVEAVIGRGGHQAGREAAWQSIGKLLDVIAAAGERLGGEAGREFGLGP